MISTRPVWDEIDLWMSDDNSGKQQLSLEEIKPVEPIAVPAIAIITQEGKLDNLVELSAANRCNDQQAYLSAVDDDRNEHGWKMAAVQGKTNTFTIQSQRDCNRQYLSVGGGCGQTYVDFNNRDDNSGKQHWTMKKNDKKEGTYTFTVGGRDRCDKVHLSTRAEWDRVDLWSTKDNDSQWFSIKPWAAYLPEPVDIPSLSHINSLGKTDSNTRLSADRNCN